MLPARRLCALALTLAACAVLPAAAPAGSDAPTARAAAKGGSVETRNGGTARFIFGNKVRCSVARKVAKRANGRKYTRLGFTCRLRSGTYGCNKPGTFKGIGFSWQR